MSMFNAVGTMERMEQFSNADNPERMEIRNRKYESNGSDISSGVCDNAGDSNGVVGLSDYDRCATLGAWLLEKRPELAEQFEREIYPNAN